MAARARPVQRAAWRKMARHREPRHDSRERARAPDSDGAPSLLDSSGTHVLDPRRTMRVLTLLASAFAALGTSAAAQKPTLPSETPAKFTPARSTFDFDR